MVEADRTTRDAFTRIYQEHSWGGDSRSGIGSSVAHASPYTTMLQDVLRDLSIASVLDLGCGDWSLAISIGAEFITPESILFLNWCPPYSRSSAGRM